MRNYMLIIFIGMLLCPLKSSYAQTNNQSEYLVEVHSEIANAKDIVRSLREKGIEANLHKANIISKVTDSAQSIWIGKLVPIETVRQVIIISLAACHSLHYVEIWGIEGSDPPESCYNKIFIGGSSVSASHSRLAYISNEELLEILKQSKSIEEFHNRIIERNKKNAEPVAQADRKG